MPPGGAQRRALIFGVSGQDGSYLAKFLLSQGYEVYGASRDAEITGFENLVALGIRESVHVVSVNMTDFRSTLDAVLQFQPDEIYNLAGQSSVGLSFQQPIETMASIVLGTLNLLEAVRFAGRPIRLYNAGSGESFGDVAGPANESTPFQPKSPYASAKAAAFWEVANYRDAYGMYACTGILFNHESPLRPRRFVTRKIVSAACRIAAGENATLRLGNLDIRRDWGWAPEYVEAMWSMLQQDEPDDFVIATGGNHSLEEFVATAFAHCGLDWRDHVEVDPSLFRPSELMENSGDPGRAAALLGWQARIRLPALVPLLVDAEAASLNHPPARA
ncbi:MAG TPA: GDP-mannose 4,6-dehydratase [Longimicrobiales bacterium]|nr:GDP-mannose 4,6-dehydratase [Longimicrobiales bacterium]